MARKAPPKGKKAACTVPHKVPSPPPAPEHTTASSGVESSEALSPDASSHAYRIITGAVAEAVAPAISRLEEKIDALLTFQLSQTQHPTLPPQQSTSSSSSQSAAESLALSTEELIKVANILQSKVPLDTPGPGATPVVAQLINNVAEGACAIMDATMDKLKGASKILQAITDEQLGREEQADIERQEAGMRDMQAQQQLADPAHQAQDNMDDPVPEGEKRDLDDDIPAADGTITDVTFNDDNMVEVSQSHDILEEQAVQHGEMEEAEVTGAARVEELTTIAPGEMFAELRVPTVLPETQMGVKSETKARKRPFRNSASEFVARQTESESVTRTPASKRRRLTASTEELAEPLGQQNGDEVDTRTTRMTPGVQPADTTQGLQAEGNPVIRPAVADADTASLSCEDASAAQLKSDQSTKSSSTSEKEVPERPRPFLKLL